MGKGSGSSTSSSSKSSGSLKQILRQFLTHFQEMESSRLEDSEATESGTSGTDLYLKEFLSLKELTEKLKKDPEYSCSEGLKDVNRRKNRYKDILPYNKTRVVISEYPGVPGSDYVNANYVRGSTGSSFAYIASQGPLPNTLVDFWRMIWETEVTVIIMACNESESGKYKCESYWPQLISSDEEDSDEDDEYRRRRRAEKRPKPLESQYGNMKVKLVKWRQVCPDFSVRTFSVRQDKSERTVIQFHYSTWPDHGVPVAVTPILELVRLMRDVQTTENRPILIHCSAGCGRTGTICSIDYVWALLRAGKLSADFSLYQIIRDMRKQRIAMVQTLEQYVLCHKAVAALFQQQLKIINSHTYENLDMDGEPLVFKSSTLIQQPSLLITPQPLESSDESSSDSLTHEMSVSSSHMSSSHLSSSCHEPIAQKTQEKVDHDDKKSDNQEKQTSVKLFDTDVWKLKGPSESVKPIRAPSLDSLVGTSFVSGTGFRSEKLVGKATVIRRPSIATLKAMFENMTTNDVDEPQSIGGCNNNSRDRNERRKQLQRSQSTKETGSTASSRMIASASRTLLTSAASHRLDISREAAAVASRAFNFDHQNDDSSGDTDDHNSQSTPAADSGVLMSSGNSSVFRPLETIGTSSLNYVPHGEKRKRIEDNRPDATTLMSDDRMSRDTPVYPGAPPKPPRTYQYRTISGASGVSQTSDGRIIVKVAPPKRPPLMTSNQLMTPDNDMMYGSFETRQLSRHPNSNHISTPNLTKLSFTPVNFNSHFQPNVSHHHNQYQHHQQQNHLYHHQPQLNFQSSSISTYNLPQVPVSSNQQLLTTYNNDPTPHTVDLRPSHHFEPIYGPLPTQRPTPLQAPHQRIYETVGLRRDLSVPSLNFNHNHLSVVNQPLPPPPQVFPKMMVHGPNRVSAVQLPPPTPAFMGQTNIHHNNSVSNVHNHHHQQQRPPIYEDIYEVPKKRPILSNDARVNRLPVTYVKPQPNPHLNKTSSSDQQTETKITFASAEGTSSDTKTKSSKSVKSSKNGSIGSNEASSLTGSVKTTKSSTSKKSVLNIFFPKKKKLKTPKGIEVLNGHPQVTSSGTPAGNRLNHSSHSLGSGMNGLIRPPHSHRFSPPAQWTQV